MAPANGPPPGESAAVRWPALWIFIDFSATAVTDCLVTDRGFGLVKQQWRASLLSFVGFTLIFTLLLLPRRSVRVGGPFPWFWTAVHTMSFGAYWDSASSLLPCFVYVLRLLALHSPLVIHGVERGSHPAGGLAFITFSSCWLLGFWLPLLLGVH